MWDVEKGTQFRTFKVLKDPSGWLFSPDSARLAAGDLGGALKIWDVATGRDLCTTELKNGRITGLCFSPDGKRLAAVCSLREVRILAAESGHEVSPPLSGVATRCLQFSPDGERLATGLFDGTVKIWDSSGQETLTLKGHTGPVSGLAFSPDGHRLISTAADMTVRIWDATPLPE